MESSDIRNRLREYMKHSGYAFSVKKLKSDGAPPHFIIKVKGVIDSISLFGGVLRTKVQEDIDLLLDHKSTLSPDELAFNSGIDALCQIIIHIRIIILSNLPNHFFERKIFLRSFLKKVEFCFDYSWKVMSTERKSIYIDSSVTKNGHGIGAILEVEDSIKPLIVNDTISELIAKFRERVKYVERDHTTSTDMEVYTFTILSPSKEITIYTDCQKLAENPNTVKIKGHSKGRNSASIDEKLFSVVDRLSRKYARSRKINRKCR